MTRDKAVTGTFFPLYTERKQVTTIRRWSLSTQRKQVTGYHLLALRAQR